MNVCKFIMTCTVNRTYDEYNYYCVDNNKYCIRYQDLTRGKEQIPLEWMQQDKEKGVNKNG